MKCVKNLKTDEVVRVSDEAAETLVKKHWEWRYVPKSYWKKTRETSDA